MSNDELKERVDIMRAAGVQRVKDGELEIVMFAPDIQPEEDDEKRSRKRERITFGGK